MTRPALPGVLEEIAEVAGIDAAWALVRAKGGQAVWLPAHARPEHWLTAAVGPEAAQKICDYFRVKDNGTKLLIPMASAAHRAAAWDEALASGLTVNETAAALGVHRRTVFRHRRAAEDDGQGDLF